MFNEDENRFIISYLFENSPKPLKSRYNFRKSQDMITCPFHADKTPSLSINFEKGIGHCFSCGWKGTVNQLLKQTLGISASKILNKNIDKNFFDMNRFIKNNESSLSLSLQDLTIPPITLEVNGKMCRLNESCKEYLRNRGIPLEVAKRFNVKYFPHGTINGLEFHERLIIPIHENGILISYEGRDLTLKDKRKVLYPPKSFTNTIYGFDSLDRTKPLYVVEGLMDLMVLRQCSEFENSTSLFGASFSLRKSLLLAQFKHIIFIPDNDSPGYDCVVNYAKALPDTTFIEVLPVPSIVKDVGDMPKIEGMDFVQYAPKWLERKMTFTEWKLKYYTN